MGTRRSPADQRSEIEMSPAKFLADIEVAVTGRDIALALPWQRSSIGVNGRDAIAPSQLSV